MQCLRPLRHSGYQCTICKLLKIKLCVRHPTLTHHSVISVPLFESAASGAYAYDRSLCNSRTLINPLMSLNILFLTVAYVSAYIIGCLVCKEGFCLHFGQVKQKHTRFVSTSYSVGISGNCFVLSLSLLLYYVFM
jgi:hypothetical protein